MTSRDDKIAVLLNPNAKRVSSRTRQIFEAVVPKADLFWSRDLREAQDHVAAIVERGYGTVFTGGGDGTVSNTINLLHEELDRKDPTPPCPQIGILKLGTGNGLAHLVGAHHPLTHLQNVLRGQRPMPRKLNLIRQGSDLLFFSGIGWDAGILNDFTDFKNRFTGWLGRKVFHSVAGYFAAIGAKTIPRELFKKDPWTIRVRNRGKAVRIIPGHAPIEVPPGALLFEGPCKLAGVSTVPFYGYGLKVFPFADSESGLMSLRIVTASAFEILRHLPSVWRGEYQSPGISDFLVDDIEIEADKPVPFQIGGDARGRRKKLEFAMSGRSIELLDFKRLAA